MLRWAATLAIKDRYWLNYVWLLRDYTFYVLIVHIFYSKLVDIRRQAASRSTKDIVLVSFFSLVE